ncbi:MAG TPA: glycoside hydrolase family 30 protein, partial [Spirochaetia bacterium]|nr:glycoside hydrolase family 30 protein [Spirochaetia bacterium]
VPVVTLKPAERFQKILGFGGAVTDASCYLFSQLDPAVRDALVAELFSPTGFGFNVGRITVAQCDFGVVSYSYNDHPGDLAMDHFSIDYDRGYIIPLIRQARELNGELFLLSSPWSPPGWMKTGGLMTGGWMRGEFLGPFAQYYLRFLQEYAKAGVKIQALTTQNESETDQLGLMPACLWHPELEMAFLRDHLSPLLRRQGLGDIELWVMDHNYIMWRRAAWMLEDAGLRSVVRGIAWHPYEGEETAMTRVHELHPEVDAHMTEWGGPFDEDMEAVCTRGLRFIDMMRNWSRSIFCWNLALDERGKPHIGPFVQFDQNNGGGLLQIHSASREVRRSSMLYALGHFSKFVKRGAIRIGSDCDVGGIRQVAFINPDGEHVVVLINEGAATEVSLVVGDRFTLVPLTPRSMSTVLFRL